MSTTTVLANEEEICKLLSGLLDLEVEAQQDESEQSLDQSFIVVYGNADCDYQALCVCDLAFANNVGAALLRIPAAYAAENTEAGECPSNLHENFAEVMNVCKNLFPKHQSGKFSLKAIHTPADGIPEEVTAFLAGEIAERVHMNVSVGGYSSGHMTLIAS